MEPSGGKPDDKVRLRKQAEALLRGQSDDLEGLSTKDIQYVLHELHVHQVELTLQNEELRRIQSEIEAARDQYSDLYNYAPVGYCTVSLKGRILEANHTLMDMLQADRQQVIGQKFSNFIVRENQDIYHLHNQRLLEDHRHAVELQMARMDQERVYVLLESRIDPQKGNEVRVIVSDITERKLADIKLKNYMRELEQANQALKDFTFIVSHDLQEPVRKIKTFGTILESNFLNKLGAEGRDYIERMISAADRIDSMLVGLLNYSRVSSTKLTFTKVNLKKIALEVLSDLEGRLAETGGEVIVEELPIIKADPLQMRQLLQNLIGNGIKYHRPETPPFVQVSGRQIENDGIQLEVKDNGIGFDMSYANFIFEPFSRVNGKVNIEGSGMGLSICKKIVDRHKGEISAQSIPGQGSIFTVTLPRDADR